MPRFARSIPIDAPDAPDTFRADGAGGRALEAAILAGTYHGVLDFCLAELAGELFGGHYGAGLDRLTAAAIKGIPQVVVPGGLDTIAFRDPSSVPERYWRRSQYVLRSGVTLVRTSAEECDQLGQEVAQKVCAAHGPTLVILPTRGFGRLSRPDGLLADADADEAFRASFRNWAYGVGVIEVDANATDAVVEELALAELLKQDRGSRHED